MSQYRAARALAWRPVRSLPASRTPRWGIVEVEKRHPAMSSATWRDWQAAITDLLEVGPVGIEDGGLDLLVVWSHVHLDGRLQYVKPGRHWLLPGTLQEIVLWPEARQRLMPRLHTLLVVDNARALAWGTRGRRLRDPQMFFVDVADYDGA